MHFNEGKLHSAIGDSQTDHLKIFDLAGWQSGHAADCNSAYAGSIPTLASIFYTLPSLPQPVVNLPDTRTVWPYGIC